MSHLHRPIPAPRTTTRATTMYDTTTTSINSTNSAMPPPIPAPRPKSEVVVTPPRRSLPPPPPVPTAGSFSTLAATAPHVPHAPPKRPMPSLPSSSSDTFSSTLPPLIASESSIVPPKRPLPSPAAIAAENPSPVALPPRAPLPSPPRAASTPSLLAKHNTSAPPPPIRSIETPPSVPSRPMPTPPRPLSTVQLAKPPPRPLSTISTASSSSFSSAHHAGPGSPQPTSDNNERPHAIPKRPVPQLPPAPEAVTEEEEEEAPKPLRSAPIARRVSMSATPLPAMPTKVPLRHVPFPVAVPEVPEPQEESPPASQSVAELLKKLDVGRQNGGSAPVFTAPSKPPRVPAARVPSPPAPRATSKTTTSTTTQTTTTTSTRATTKAVDPIPPPAPAPRQVPRPVPAPPTLPQRPSLPARPALPQRPSLPQRPDPAVPPRPELPARPALPKRPPQQSAVHEHQSSLSTHSSSTTRATTAPSGEQRVQKSSHYASQSSSSCSTSTFRAGEDVMEALARSQPASTAEFNGERLDLTLADFSVQDQHALACPREEEESIARLSWYLTSPFPDDQVAQLRSIFKWISHNIIYDVAGFMSGNLGDNSAEGVLRNKTGVCAGFANIFFALAAPQDLGVTMVFGVARGFGCEAGGESLGGPHAWNAVTVHGECRLIDSTWGAGPISECGTIDPNPEARFLPHYFLVRPEALIFTHWPTNSREQYLNPPVHVDLYRALPFRYPLSWTLGILPSGSSATHTVWTDNDYAEVEIRLVKRAWDGFIPTLICMLTWDPTGEQLYAHVRWDREDEESVYMTARCFCPSAGSGTLKVTGKAADSEAMQTSSAMSFRVVNSGTGANMQPLFPPYLVKHFGFSVLEPASARVQSGRGGKQKIRVKVYNLPRGRTQPRLCVHGGLIPIPDMLKQVGPGLYETEKTLRPGKYHIGHMGVGIEHLAPFDVV